MYGSVSDIPAAISYHLIQDIRLFDKFLIKTSSGCPYQCTFCYARPAVDRKITYRDIDEVVGEIKTIKKQRGKGFILRIIDEAFILNRNRVIEFCSRLRKERLSVEWICYGRVNRTDEKLLKIMFDSGCREIYYGIESGSNRILQRIKKGFLIQEAVDAALITKRIIPHVTASFMYRYPFETLQDFKDTLVTIRYLQAKGISTQLHPLVPVKNSEIYLKYKKRLRFSLEEPCDYMLNSAIGDMPRQFREFILDYPEVFYDYGYYATRDLAGINQMIKNNARKMSSRTATLW
jgi:radical SAM superfamily enzyme YgiQ (UPF0313 family)